MLRPEWIDKVTEVSMEEALGLLEMGVDVRFDFPNSADANAAGHDAHGFLDSYADTLKLYHNFVVLPRGSVLFILEKPCDEA